MAACGWARSRPVCEPGPASPSPTLRCSAAQHNPWTLHGDPPELRVGEVLKAGPTEVPTCTCCLLLSSKVSSAPDQSQNFLILDGRIRTCHSCFPPCASSTRDLCPPNSPSQPGTLPGPQLHSQERQGSHADHGHEQPGQDSEGQKVGESCEQRGARADPCRHQGCQLSETGGGSESPAGMGPPPAPFPLGCSCSTALVWGQCMWDPPRPWGFP